MVGWLLLVDGIEQNVVPNNAFDSKTIFAREQNSTTTQTSTISRKKRMKEKLLSILTCRFKGLLFTIHNNLRRKLRQGKLLYYYVFFLSNSNSIEISFFFGLITANGRRFLQCNRIHFFETKNKVVQGLKNKGSLTSYESVY